MMPAAQEAISPSSNGSAPACPETLRKPKGAPPVLPEQQEGGGFGMGWKLTALTMTLGGMMFSPKSGQGLQTTSPTKTRHKN